MLNPVEMVPGGVADGRIQLCNGLILRIETTKPDACSHARSTTLEEVTAYDLGNLKQQGANSSKGGVKLLYAHVTQVQRRGGAFILSRALRTPTRPSHVVRASGALAIEVLRKYLTATTVCKCRACTFWTPIHP